MIKYEVVVPRASKAKAEAFARQLRVRGVLNVQVREIDDYADIYADTVFKAMTEYRRRTGATFVQAVDWIRTHPEAWQGGADEVTENSPLKTSAAAEDSPAAAEEP